MRRRRNPSESNPYGIDDRVWSNIVGSETTTIDKIMFAAALDPLLIHELDEIQPPRSFIECVQLADMGTRGDLRSYLRGVLNKWVMSNSQLADIVVREIASWDTRLGVWCAAACAESVLYLSPPGDDRPRIAVETAKDWVILDIDRTAIFDQTAIRRDAYDADMAVADAYDASYIAFASRSFDVPNAAIAAQIAADDAAYVDDVAVYAAEAASCAIRSAQFAAENNEAIRSYAHAFSKPDRDPNNVALAIVSDGIKYRADEAANYAGNAVEHALTAIIRVDESQTESEAIRRSRSAVRDTIVRAIETYPVDR